MKSAFPSALFIILLYFSFPSVAQAGMPGITLTDIAELRIQAISFFLMVFLVSACLIQLIWNRLRTDFAFLPRLSLRTGDTKDFSLRP